MNSKAFSISFASDVRDAVMQLINDAHIVSAVHPDFQTTTEALADGLPQIKLLIRYSGNKIIRAGFEGYSYRKHTSTTSGLVF